MDLAPIILFVYNRPEHTQKTINALSKNEFAKDSPLIIFSDGFKNNKDKNSVLEVRKIIRSSSGFKTLNIVEREKNYGLANSIIFGVQDIINRYGKAIVLEDDIVTSNYFLKFMNETLNFYENNGKIFSITGYNFPIKIPQSYKHFIYISPRPSSWGWATWKNRWEKVDWQILDYDNFINNKNRIAEFNLGGDDLSSMLKNQMNGKISSWAVRWAYAHYKYNTYCLYPVNSLLQNIGADKSGTHTKKTKRFDVQLLKTELPENYLEDVDVDELIMGNFRKYFSKKNIVQRLFNVFQ